MATEEFANNSSTVVISGGTDTPPQGTVETWIVASSASFPAATTSPPAVQFHVADPASPSEKILVTNISGTTWTVTRGAENTAPVTHSADFTIYAVVTAGWLNSISGGSSSANAVDWVNVVNAYGADPTGAADSTTAIQAAVSALPSRGGVIYFPAGSYKVTSTITIGVPAVYLIGDGMWSSVIYYHGSGDCIRMYSTQVYTSGFGGGVQGLTIDGTSAGAGACGIHAGDIYQLEWDAGVRFFQGSGSKGFWFDNQYFWCEDMHGHIWAQQNTANVVFDNSANVGGSAATSFARTLLDIVLDCKGTGDGVILQGGAELYDSRIGIYGNMDYGTSQFHALTLTGGPSYSFTATHASPCVFTAAGSYFSNGTYVTLSGGSLPGGFSAQGYYVVNASGATFELAASGGGSAINSTSTGSGTVQGPFSRIYASRLDIGVECNATVNAYQPITISFGTQGSNSIRDCTGIIDFTGSSGFATTVNSVGSFDFDGICMGDVNLFRVVGAGQAYFSLGAISNGAFITTRYNALGIAAPSGNVTGAILGTNDPGAQGANDGNWANRTFTLVNAGTGSITFAAEGTSHVATGTACVVPAGTSMTFLWWANASVWYPAQGSLGSVTAGDTSIVVGGTATAPTIETGTLDVIAADHPAAANWSNNSYKITSLANGSGAQDAAAFGQIPVVDSTAADILPAGIQAAGSNGKWADSGHVHQNNADLSLYLAPSGATGETYPRTLANAYTSIMTSQSVYASAIPLPAGLVVNNLNVFNGSTAPSGVTHGWLALSDSSRIVRAVTADQTSSFGSAFNAVSLPVASTYTVPTAGLYYFWASVTASTMGSLSIGNQPLAGPNNAAPQLAGTIATAFTTPPATGSTFATLSSTSGGPWRFYGYTS